ncbi:MarR family winged helix-turn-helix transcriptional regulator [Streptomyces sp. NPDC020965]|uniref:MarR family winged helix-turn-helix transcriptional regulator n=1 Tax=Streptomyces sp. NPDC020965 TaxID=3365105 RepID=UPI0037BD56CC
MCEDPAALHPHSHEAVPEASEIIELLEVLWERGRSTVTAAPVSTAQVRVMYIIERDEGINLRTLGERLGAAAPSVTRICDRLRALGFLHKAQHPDDRREVRLWLTAAGTAHLRDLRAHRERALLEALAAMTPAARHALAEGLTGFRDAVREPLPGAGSRHLGRSA